jgi:hypothetical protein
LLRKGVWAFPGQVGAGAQSSRGRLPGDFPCHLGDTPQGVATPDQALSIPSCADPEYNCEIGLRSLFPPCHNGKEVEFVSVLAEQMVEALENPLPTAVAMARFDNLANLSIGLQIWL